MRFFRVFIPALMVLALLAAPAPSNASVSVGISVGIAPPVLPIYEQPPIPGPGYIWTPGYWAWGPYGYYWVPGTWVFPPVVGVLWTPPWWGWVNGVYLFHTGYWGPTVGFYGGINYGFGYGGIGYEGGYWQGREFFYNRTVNNITNVNNVNITNVYNKTVVAAGPTTTSRVSFNGGTGGVTAQPTAQQQAAMNQRHIGPTALQTQHFNAARSNTALLSSKNNGQPPITATNQAGRFNTAGVAPTTGKIQGNASKTITGPSGPAGGGASGPKTLSKTNTGPAGPTGTTGGGAPGPKTFSKTNTGPTGPIGSKGVGNTGPKNYRATNTGPTGPSGSKGGPKTFAPTAGGNPPHVTNQTVHPPSQPKGPPKGQPQGKNQPQG